MTKPEVKKQYKKRVVLPANNLEALEKEDLSFPIEQTEEEDIKQLKEFSKQYEEALPPLKKKKKISRKKPGEKGSKYYFTDETQEAIVNYQLASTSDEKHHLYKEIILPAMDSLVSNLINVYGFNVQHESREDLKHECLIFLYGILGKFKASYGTRAFAYFNVCAKHWLTVKSKNSMKSTHAFISLDDKDSFSEHDSCILEEKNKLPSMEDIILASEFKNNVYKLVGNIKIHIKTPQEQSVLNAIELLLKHIEDLDFITKRAVLNYIKEISGVEGKPLSITLSNLKKYYRQVKSEVEQNEQQ